jgi:hypothetical protein
MKGIVIAAALVVSTTAIAAATGTIRVQQSDGDVKTYQNVKIRVANQTLWITSADGKGTIVVGKAACDEVGALIRCLAYDATVVQNGRTLHVPLATGTVIVNPTKVPQQLSHSSTQLPPRGILLTAESRRGTWVTMKGTIDEVQR